MKGKHMAKLMGIWITVLTISLTSTVLAAHAQSAPIRGQKPNDLLQDIPDAPSAVQIPRRSFIHQNALNPNLERLSWKSDSDASWKPDSGSPENAGVSPKVVPVTHQREPTNQLNPENDLYTISVGTNFVQVPVTVKDNQGRRVDGLLPQDFVIKEDGQPQTLTFFTSDPFQLVAAIVLDLGMADIAVQRVNQTYNSLVGSFSPYDEVALYTYSSAVSQVTDFTDKPARLIAALDSMALVRGHNNGPPVLGGPLGPQPMMINGRPVGTAALAPVLTPPKRARVMNDAILRAALDLSRRPNTRRKMILVISDGFERGSQASFRQVVKVLQTHNIQLKALVLDQGALPIYKQASKIPHLLWKGRADLLPKYTKATGGGNVFSALSCNSIELAYSAVTYEARNQYTLGYSMQAANTGRPHRNIEVLVDRKNLSVFAKEGYYPIPKAGR
jgi:VWFA-related protein